MSGCRLVSAGLTAHDNAVSARRAEITLRELDTVEAGTRIVLQMSDASEIAGKYAGLSPDSAVRAAFLTDAAIDLGFFLILTIPERSLGLLFGG